MITINQNGRDRMQVLKKEVSEFELFYDLILLMPLVVLQQSCLLMQIKCYLSKA